VKNVPRSLKSNRRTNSGSNSPDASQIICFVASIIILKNLKTENSNRRCTCELNTVVAASYVTLALTAAVIYNIFIVNY
jgi:hypothetical protein